MSNALIANDELNKRIRGTQSRIAKLAGYQESQREVIEAAKQQAKAIFGTDDLVEIRSQIQSIHERNTKVISYKDRAVGLCESVLKYVENNQPVPDQLLANLEKMIESSQKHVPTQA